jgi:hypothetical protein
MLASASEQAFSPPSAGTQEPVSPNVVPAVQVKTKSTAYSGSTASSASSASARPAPTPTWAAAAAQDSRNAAPTMARPKRTASTA